MTNDKDLFATRDRIAQIISDSARLDITSPCYMLQIEKIPAVAERFAREGVMESPGAIDDRVRDFLTDHPTSGYANRNEAVVAHMVFAEKGTGKKVEAPAELLANLTPAQKLAYANETGNGGEPPAVPPTALGAAASPKRNKPTLFSPKQIATRKATDKLHKANVKAHEEFLKK